VKGFARPEFQLMLLRRMADFQPDLVAGACAELGVTRAQVLDAHNRWQSMLRARRAPRSLALYLAVLGPPEAEETTRLGDATLTAYSWPLPRLWPSLRWQTVIGGHDVVLHGQLVRAFGAPDPDLPGPAELPPWSCVVAEAVARYPTARQVDPQVPTHWLVRVNGVELWFAHGLFQVARTGAQRPSIVEI
jgi:hypothetical protein